MALNLENLSLIGGGSKAGNAPQMWSYVSEDTPATIDSSGYFDNGTTTNTGLRDLMNVGDLIYIHGTSAGTAVFGHHIVLSNASGVIDVADADAIGASDTD
jgi:hypothetical protein|tara:strand:+ start:2876 stop:3178 length:303 start_codon:yes stop_codon:yes gene_type:complete